MTPNTYPTPGDRSVAPVLGMAPMPSNTLGATLGGTLGSVPAPAPTMPAPGNSLGSLLGNQALPANSQLDAGLTNFQAEATKANETANTRFYLERLQLQETPEYHDQFTRNYIPQQRVDGAVCDLAEDVLRSGGVPASNILAQHAPNLFSLNMSNDPNNRIHIPHGWRSKRMKFLMLVREEDIQFGKVRMTYINGFTDHFGISTLTGQTHLDENMVFYINSIVTLAEQKHLTPGSTVPQTMWNVVQATQVVDGQLVGMDASGSHISSVSLLRPSDLISGYANQSAAEVGISDWLTIDGSTGNGGGVCSQFNNMANNLPTSYLNRLITPILSGFNGSSSRPGTGGLGSTMAAAANRSEFTLNGCPFLRYMSRSTGMPLSSRFTIGQLSRLDSTIGQRIKHFPIKQADYSNLNAMSLDSTPWNYASLETEIATKLASVIPSLFWENFAMCGGFSFTNATPNFIPVMKWDFLQFITPTGLPGFQQKLEAAIKNVVLVDISRNNMFAVHVNCFVDVSGDIQLAISYDGRQAVRYAAPAFSCGLLNPIYTSNQQIASGSVTNFGRMVDAIQTVRDTEIGSLGSVPGLGKSYGI